MIELKHITEFPQEIIALDEVGRSPLCGPVVIGAIRVVIRNPSELKYLAQALRRKGVKDSKLLNRVKREKILKSLKVSENGFREKGQIRLKDLLVDFIIWEIGHEDIEKENIFEASMRGMKEAALSLCSFPNENVTVLIDGQSKLRWKGETPPWQEIPIIKGDVKSPLIGLASILAKEKRDAFMRDMDEIFPHYGLKTNSGYPTREHREAIRKYGPSPIHRKTFSKVKEFLESDLVG